MQMFIMYFVVALVLGQLVLAHSLAGKRPSAAVRNGPPLFIS